MPVAPSTTASLWPGISDTTDGVPQAPASVIVIPHPSFAEVEITTHALRYNATSESLSSLPGSDINSPAPYCLISRSSLGLSYPSPMITPLTSGMCFLTSTRERIKRSNRFTGTNLPTLTTSGLIALYDICESSEMPAPASTKISSTPGGTTCIRPSGIPIFDDISSRDDPDRVMIRLDR